MERSVVERIVEVGMVVDRKRHAKCWQSLHHHFLRDGVCKATLQPVDTDTMMEMRQKMADRVETRVLIDNVFAEPRAEFTIYVFHGVGVSNLHLLRTPDHAWALEALTRALNDFRVHVRHPAEVPEVVAYACQSLDSQWYPNLHFPALQWSADMASFIPWLSPDVAMWSDTVVPSRYAYYVHTHRDQSERDLFDRLQAYLKLSSDAPHDTALPPPSFLVAPLDGRVDLAKQRARDHASVQTLLPEVLEAAGVDMDLFHESINRAFAIQRGIEENQRIVDTAKDMEKLRVGQERQRQQQQQEETVFDLTLDKALSEKSEGDICPEEDAISRQLYSNLAWNMGTKPLMSIMAEKKGLVERYSASARAMRPFPHIESSYQLSAAVFATINRVLTVIDTTLGSKVKLYCSHCKDLRNTYRRLRALLSHFPGGRPDTDPSYLRAETCVACAMILCVTSAVFCYGLEMRSAERVTVVDKYLARVLGKHWKFIEISVDSTFLKAMQFFRFMGQAVDQQRRPWSFRYDYHPVRWDGTTASFRHSPTVCCDESLTVTALVLRSLTKMGSIGVDLYENQMQFTNEHQRTVVDNCFTPCIDFFMDQSTVTETTKAKTKLRRSEVGVCVDRSQWDADPVVAHRPSASDRHYLYTESFCEHVDSVATSGHSLLGSGPYVGLEDLHYEYTLAWPLMVRNFMQGSEDTAAAGGDLRLYYSVYGLQKMLFSKWTRGHASARQATMVTPVNNTGVSVKIYAILPALLEKVLMAYPAADQVHLFDLLVDPLVAAVRKIDTPIEEGASVTVKITTDATWTIYTALWAFVHALSERILITDTVLEQLYKAFSSTRRLREDHPEAARLCVYLYRQKDQCRKDGHFHVPNPFYGKSGGTAIDREVRRICGASNVPPHHLLYRAVLSDHVSPSLTRDVFLGISSRLHWRSRPGLSASLAYFADACDSAEARRAVGVLASLRRAQTVYEEYVSDTVSFDEDDNDSTYPIVTELFASLEILTRFPATIHEEDRLDIVERNWRLDGPVDTDRASVYRGLLTRDKVLSLALFTNHAWVVCSRSIPLLGSWLNATPWAEADRTLTATEVMPVWHPMLLPTRLDHYRLLNVVRGSGELAPFTGAHPDFLMAVVTEPIEAITIPSTSDFGISLTKRRTYNLSDVEAQQWTRRQIADAFYKGQCDQDLVSISLDSIGKRYRSDGGEEERPTKKKRRGGGGGGDGGGGDIERRIQRLRESGEGPSVVFLPRHSVMERVR